MNLKSRVAGLALFGAQPAFVAPLYVGRPNLVDREAFQRRLDGVLDRGWLTNNGPMVQEFEREIADYLDVEHCVAMCNATVALEILIRGAGLSGEVIVPSFTFVATAHALQWQEITPVFCDIDPTTHNLDPRQIERLITPRTTGIIGVHVWGRPCPVDELEAIADHHRLKLIFDAAHALGCSHGGRKIGGFGLAEVFSFHATKFVNSFEGGAVVTNDDVLAEKLRLMRNFGFAGFDNVVYLGTNGKMSEVSAAMGITSLESVGEFIKINRRNYHLYREGLADLDGVRIVRYDEHEDCNYQYVVFEVDESAAGLGRDDLIRVLWAENVIARRYFYPGCHRMEPYRSYYPNANLLLPRTEDVAGRVLLLPTGTSIGEGDVRLICEIIRVSMANAGAVRARLESMASPGRVPSPDEAVVAEEV